MPNEISRAASGASETVAPKKGKNAVIAALVFLASAIVVIGGLAYAVQATGTVRLPVLHALYRGPAPVRVVEPAPVGAERLRAIVGERLMASFEAGEQPAHVRFSESELTGALQDAALDAMRQEGWRAELLQVAAVDGALEFTAKLSRDRMRFEMRAEFVPVVEGGGLRFDIRSARIGDYPVHPALARRISGAVFSRDFGTWVFRLGSVAFTGVEIGNGMVDVAVHVAQ